MYKRVLLKLSGEALSGNSKNFDADVLHSLAEEIKEAQSLGVEIAIVVGGGNFIRGKTVAEIGIDRVQGDYMGMLATIMNALAIQASLESVGLETRVQTSIEMNKEIAGYVFHHTTKELSVDVHNPDILVRVEYRKDAIYIMDNMIPGAGGYPVGIGGKALLMLSGGIDSPVAGYLTMKRGVDLECIHYASPPYTNELAREKVLDLVNVLKDYTHGSIKVHIVPFTELQLSVYDHCDESYAMTVRRRMMYRIAEGVAKKNDCLAIVNGESIGQVASQTLESMNTINQVITTPVIRPVACMDKLEIIKIAEKIGTYDISIRPYEDCCTIFTPHNPATKPKAYKAEGYEAEWDFGTEVQKCIDHTETIIINSKYKNDEDLF